MADHSPAAEQSIGQAAGDLKAVQAFVNTRDIEQAADELASPAALARWLRAAGLLDEQQATGPGPGQQDLDLALRLREALRGVLRAHAGHGTAGEAAAELSKVAGSLRIRLEVAPDGQIRPGRRPGRSGGTRPAAADSGRGWHRRHLGPAQGLQRGRLPVGVL